jgi:hypothetical protein
VERSPAAAQAKVAALEAQLQRALQVSATTRLSCRV